MCVKVRGGRVGGWIGIGVGVGVGGVRLVGFGLGGVEEEVNR